MAAAVVEDEFDAFEADVGLDDELEDEFGLEAEVGPEAELGVENADSKVGVERDAMKRHHYSRLVEFCESPEEDADGFYDINALTDNVEQALEEDAENNDHFLRKVLEQYGWDGRDFKAHEQDERINLSHLAATLRTGDSIPRFVPISFCQECNNMLQPQEDEINRRLMYKCHNTDCRGNGYKIPATHNCCYVSHVAHDVESLAQVNKDLASDPTLPHTTADDNIICKKCNSVDAVYFQAQSNRDKSDMRLYYVCSKCGNHWTE